MYALTKLKQCFTLQNGLLFGLPVVLDTQSEDINVGDKVLLTYQGQNIATVKIDSKWLPNKPVEALKCYGTSSIEHPAVQMISMERGKYYIGKKRCHASLLLSACQCKHIDWPCCASFRAALQQATSGKQSLKVTLPMATTCSCIQTLTDTSGWANSVGWWSAPSAIVFVRHCRRQGRRVGAAQKGVPLCQPC